MSGTRRSDDKTGSAVNRVGSGKINIDGPTLVRLGYRRLTPGQANELIRETYETLQLVVGQRLAAQMSSDQMAEFERFFESRDDDGAFRWLASRFPDYQKVAREAYEEITAVLRGVAERSALPAPATEEAQSE